jgi:hypothetical protein
MGTRISHSRRRKIRTCLLLALVFAGVSHESRGQAGPGAAKQAQPPAAQIAEWEDDVSGAIHFLHELFPDINPASKSIIVNNRDWRLSPGGVGSFTIDICEPDFPSRNEELQRDFFTRHDIQCSVLTTRATFLMTGSQLGPVPAQIFVGRSDIEKRWSELAALLLAHPNWSEEQVEEAMKASGVKYGAGGHNDVVGLLHDVWPKLEIFFGKLKLDSMEYFPPLLTDPKQPVGPSWIIKAHPSEQDSTKLRNSYTLVFNSFDGAFESEMIGPAAGPSEKH